MHIYLSPHHDDICFSLAHFAGRYGGDLVNLFTRSHYVAAGQDLPADPAASVETVTRLRREEDLRFTRATGLVRHDLELLEPGLCGRGPFDRAGLDAEIGSLSQQLVPYLLTLLPEGGRQSANLFCPMGIGGHRNHLSTLLVVRAAYEALRSRCTLYLYEDLPYASVPAARDAGLRHASQVFRGFGLSGSLMPLSATDSARKMERIRLYASQLYKPPPEAHFTPASGSGPGLHEIVWRVSGGDAR